VIKVLLADDHLVVLQGLRALLESEGDIEVVGEATDGLEAMMLLEKLLPDVLVMDLMMPNLNGLETARRIKKKGLPVKVVVLSMHESEPYVVQALKYGVMGYIPKDSSSEELVDAIRQVAKGQRYLNAVISDRVIDSLITRMDSGGLDPYDTLTSRERAVFQMVAEGESNSEIGQRLSISPRTVETHRANMMRKLGLKTQTDVVRYAIRRGILSLDG
jgi:DNA-binding NarL/FixJ family response regulator